MLGSIEDLDNLDKITNSTFSLFASFGYINQYVDIDFLRWLTWLFTPIIVSVLYPIVFAAF